MRPKTRSAPQPRPPEESHFLRNSLIVLFLGLGAFVAYAYNKNPEGCLKVVADSRAVVNSIFTTQLASATVPDATAPKPAATNVASTPQAPTPATAVTASTSPAATDAPAPAAENAIPAQPNWTWNTLDGKTYHDVVITKMDANSVSINHSLGVTHIAMNMLSDDLKKQLHYDPAAAAAARSKISGLVDGKLIAANGSAFATPDGKVRYYAIYYSAAWCPPCHAFTPKLVAWYNKFKPSHPEFEVIFVSSDHNESAMLAYMKEMSMPWPGVRYSDMPEHGTGIEKFANSGIPDLVLVDSGGNVLSDSFAGDRYLGPYVVIEDINRIVGGTSPVPMVQSSRPALPSDTAAFASSAGGSR